MRRYPRIVVLFALMAAILTACAPSTPPPPEFPTKTPTMTPEPTATATPAFIPRTFTTSEEEQIGLRTVNAVQGLEAVDIYAELSAISLNLGFGTSSSGDSRLAAGNYTFRVVPAGGSIDDTPILQQAIDLPGGTSYTLLLSGAADAPTLTAIPDDSSPLEAGRSRLLVINAAADVPSVQIANEDGGLLIDGLAYGHSSAPITVEAGRYNLQTLVGGSPWFDLRVDLRESRQITVIIMGTREQWSTSQTETNVPGLAEVRFVNAIVPDAGAVDVYLDETLLATDLTFGSATDLSEQPTTPASLRVVPAGQPADATPLLAASIAPNPGDRLTLIATGDAVNNRLVTFDEGQTRLNDGEVSLTFIQLIPGVDTIRSGGTDGVLQEPVELDYAIPTTVVTTAGDQSFVWQQAFGDNSGDPLFDSALTMQPNTAYLYLITNRTDAPALVFDHPVEGESTTVQPETTTLVRWINAIPDTPLSFSLDDTVQVTNLAYATSSDLQAIVPNDYGLVLSNAEGSSSTPVTLEAYKRYSIYAFGSAADPQVAIIEDADVTFPVETGRIRLVNIGSRNEDDALSLWFAEASGDEVNAAYALTPVPDAANNPVNLPFGVRQLVVAVAGRASLAGQLHIGRYDFFVVDNANDGIIARLPAMPLEDGAAYEVVAVRAQGAPSPLFFVLDYPPASD
ncbi:MAG: DUF4397 domain-containing protein [Anaerolineae bacterium]|nr:DUF4397 domain-containing protein [Anaerolineae bacterium]